MLMNVLLFFQLLSIYMDSGIASLNNSQQFIDKFQMLQGPHYEILSEESSFLQTILPNSISWVTKTQKVIFVDGSQQAQFFYIILLF